MKIRFLCAAALLAMYGLGGLAASDKPLVQKEAGSIQAIAATQSSQNIVDLSGS